MIIRLGKVYTKWTDKKPGISQQPYEPHEPGGPFFRFVLVYLEIYGTAENRPANPKALSSAIKRALRMGAKFEAQGLKI